MRKIKSIIGREILDSRGNPTVEVDVVLESGHRGRMMVPSGASTGIFEALELRDQDPDRYQGKGVTKAVENVNKELAKALIGMSAEDQEQLDQAMIELDGSNNKSRLGANAILGISVAAANAAAASYGMPLYQYLEKNYLKDSERASVPMPMVNIISGGLHAGKNIDLQDFLVVPIGSSSMSEALRMVSVVYRKMKELLLNEDYEANLVADEGGFGPSLPSNQAALDILVQAMEAAKLTPGADMMIALDVASSHFYQPEQNEYQLKSENRQLAPSEMITMLEGWINKYPIISIEDGLAEDDWNGWVELTKRLGKEVELVGDDFFTTNPARIQRGIELKAANSVLIKMNQIGTLTETVRAVQFAKAAGYRTVISARSGETEDAVLADLAVGLNGGQIKIGSIARSERLAKYNQLLRIEEELGCSRFIGKAVFNRLQARC